MRYIVLVVLFIVCSIVSGQSYVDSIPPKARFIDQLYVNDYFMYEYDEHNEQSIWVYYILKNEYLLNTVARNNYFKIDNQVVTGSASPNDYFKSGYDRGHLAPAKDLSYTKAGMQASFLMSNISPQVPQFNRKIWLRLEELIRSWSYKYDLLHIVTGPILSDNLKRIGVNNVSVPEYFYKAVLCVNGDDISMIGFIIPNKESSNILIDYVVCVDDIESIIDIDLFYTEEYSVVMELENETCISCFDW